MNKEKINIGEELIALGMVIFTIALAYNNNSVSLIKRIDYDIHNYEEC